jgi:hypothetical protein
MKTAYEFWIERYGETPEYDSEKLAVAMMAEYGIEMWNAALDAVLKLDCDTMEDETERVYIPVDEIENLKK